MAIYSPLRSRRLAAQQAEATQRLIIFQLRQATFALPLDKVYKATTFERLYGDANGAGVTLTTYQGRELTVIDVGSKIFGLAPTLLPPLKSLPANDSIDPKHLLILQRQDGQLVGLPIDSPPSIQSLAASVFVSLAATDPQYANLHCVSARSSFGTTAAQVDASTSTPTADAAAEADSPGLSQRTIIFLLDATLILTN